MLLRRSNLENYKLVEDSFEKAIAMKLTDEARTIIDEFHPITLVENRVKSHLQARYLSAIGLKQEAIEQLQLTRSRFGDNLFLLKDLSVLFRQIGFERQWVESTSLLTDSFNASSKLISEETRRDVLFYLFKERFDQGYIDIAIKIGQRILKQHSSDSVAEKVRRSLGRLSLILGSEKFIADTDRDMYTETLTQITQTGVQQSLLTLKSKLESDEMSSIDKSLLFYDCADNLLCRGVFPDSLFKKIPKTLQPKPIDTFTSSLESFIKSMMNEKVIYWYKIQDNPKDLAIFDQIRMLSLQMRWGTDRIKKYSDFQFQKKMQSMDVSSQVFWSNRIKK